jgi:hypothetical protein
MPGGNEENKNFRIVSASEEIKSKYPLNISQSYYCANNA